MKKFFAFLIILLVSAGVFAQTEKEKFEITMKIDNLGNANIELKQSADAMKWKQWNKVYGENPSLLKRNISYILSAYELGDFSFKKDDMNRTFYFTFKAKGVARYKGDGKWEIEVEEDMTPKKMSKTNWLFVSSSKQGNTVSENYTTIILPTKTKESEIGYNEFGKKVLKYKAGKDSHFPAMLITGGVSFLLGIIFIVAGFFVKD